MAKVSEEEAINITMENGYEGNELHTKVWNDRGCLNADGTQKGLISTLETIYNSVTVEGKGKKRIYILSDKKEKVTDRKFNYKGTVDSEEDILMKKYIINKLILLKTSNSYSYKGWSDILELPQTSDISYSGSIDLVKSSYIDFVMKYRLLYNSKDIVSNFINEINMRNKAVLQNSFRALQKENKILVEEIYKIKYSLEQEFIEVSEQDYTLVNDKLKSFLETKKVSYFSYIKSVTNSHKSEKMKKVINEVKEYLKEEFNVDMLFKEFKVEVLNDDIVTMVSQKEFKQAYFDKLLTLTEQRQSKVSYTQSTSFRKRFYMYNMILLLEQFGQRNDIYIHKLRQGLDKEVKKYMEDLFTEEREKMRDNLAFGKLPD